ncbi:hypothetical protein L484_018318 [Morus notabilis]|uniref:Uncharacterized protein n=1 Tax=Morus notabilis TaxID=981085 RepID=W9QNT4_9ROSA|nr:hypothetical protein L484_018318 [Morus notabilis]
MPTPGLEKSSRMAQSFSLGSETSRFFRNSESVFVEQFQMIREGDFVGNLRNLDLGKTGKEMGKNQRCRKVRVRMACKGSECIILKFSREKEGEKRERQRG